jgi:hypothetical protein
MKQIRRLAQSATPETARCSEQGIWCLTASVYLVYIFDMKMKTFLMRIDPAQLLELRRLGKRKGGLAVTQLIRMAIAEFLERQKRMEK